MKHPALGAEWWPGIQTRTVTVPDRCGTPPAPARPAPTVTGRPGIEACRRSVTSGNDAAAMASCLGRWTKLLF